MIVDLANKTQFRADILKERGRLAHSYKISSTGKLTGTLKKSRISNLFVGSGAFTATPSNTFQGLIVDEAHRLNEKSGLFSNLGENQIRAWAESLGGKVTQMDLESQFPARFQAQYN